MMMSKYRIVTIHERENVYDGYADGKSCWSCTRRDNMESDDGSAGRLQKHLICTANFDGIHFDNGRKQ